jgi:phage terminase large subunit-like protein
LTRGPRVVKWIESNLIHTVGDYYGQPFRLTPEQKAFIYRAYELRSDGSRRKRRVLRGKPKGYGKTEEVAAICCYELGGGDTVSPEIPVGAASFEQADLVFGAAKIMLGEGPLADYFEVYDTEILIKERPGRMFRVAAAAGTNDGLRPTFFAADEVHEWIGSKARVHLVISNGLAKRRGSWRLDISTAGADAGIEYGEPDTLLGSLYLYGKKVESGEIQDDSFLFDWLEATVDFNPLTRKGWDSAVRSLHPPPFVDIEAVVEECMRIPEFEARRYYLNQWTAVVDAWLPPGAWRACTVDSVIFSPKREIFVGVDAATKHDSTAVVVAQWDEERRKLRVAARIWERPLGPDGRPDPNWKLPIAEVDNYVRSLRAEFRSNLVGVQYDPALFERSAQQLEVEKVPMIEMPQSDARMVPACQATYELIVQGRLEHAGDLVFARHIAAAAAVEAQGGGWRLRKKNARAKMDGAVALTMAVDLAVRPPADRSAPSVMFV